MMTTLKTLISIKGSVFCTVFENPNWREKIDNDGFVFIDYNPDIFTIVLDYLRSHVPVNVSCYPIEKQASLKIAADFFGVPEMTQPIKVNDRFASSAATCTITPDGSCATRMQADGWDCVVVGEKLVTSGKHDWFIRIEKTKSANIMLGVAGNQPLTGCAHSTQGYYLYANNGKTFAGQPLNKSHVPYYDANIPSGSVVGIHLDYDCGTLSFSLNGHDLGLAYNSVSEKGKPLRLTVSMYNVEDSVRIVDRV